MFEGTLCSSTMSTSSLEIRGTDGSPALSNDSIFIVKNKWGAAVDKNMNCAQVLLSQNSGSIRERLKGTEEIE